MHLFVSFYKLLFLGTDFAHKMLKIKLEKNPEGSSEVRQIVVSGGTTTDEEPASDGNFLNDTSDILSDNSPDTYVVHEGSVQATLSDPDPYQKIKLHASLALRNLVKNNSKIIANYWYILFPTFMMRP